MDYSFKNFELHTYEDIKVYFDELLSREVKTKEGTLEWIKDYENLSANIQEDSNRRYVHNSCDTTNEEYKEAYMYFINEISPKLQEVSDVINKKLIALPYLAEIAQENEAYEIYMRSIQKDLEMFREENISLNTELAETDTEYWEIAWAMMIEYQGKTLTLQQAAVYLEQNDENIRKEVYEKIRDRRLQDSEKLDNLLTKQIALRNQIAQNAWYPSFVEYQRDARNRFDYTQQEVFDFHAGVKEYIVPLVQKIFDEKKKALQVDSLQPYNIAAPESDLPPLKPYGSAEEFLKKSITTVAAVDPEFGENLELMKQAGRFDLDSREWKRPWGYNCPMPVTLWPFIFMNSAGTQKDVEIFVHEAWHAMHSFCMKDISLPWFRQYPIEIAEVASMSMEFLTMKYWNIFYNNSIDVQRAQKWQIDWSIEVLPWVSIVDMFQYWLYKNPTHTVKERDEKFSALLKEYHPWIDYSNYEKNASKRWQSQLHIFELPFYYIEYGICQLGAFGVWKNYMENPTEALKKYKTALSLWYTKKLPALYEAAGITFDFSPKKIKELIEFVWEERKKIVG